MRVTVEIDEDSLKRVRRMTGLRKKSPAISSIIADAVRQDELRELLEKIERHGGEVSLTNKELKRRRRDHADRCFRVD